MPADKQGSDTGSGADSATSSGADSATCSGADYATSSDADVDDGRTGTDARDAASSADARVTTGDGDVTRIQLASWDSRFWAWVVDVLLVGAVLSGFGEVAGVFSLVTGSLSLTLPFVGANGLALWLYWTTLEGYGGQSAGKLVMNVAVVDERGDEAGYVKAAISGFGKAFLLPLDVLVGWLAMEGEYRRLFNRLSGTIVVRVPDTERTPEGVEYVPPE